MTLSSPSAIVDDRQRVTFDLDWFHDYELEDYPVDSPTDVEVNFGRDDLDPRTLARAIDVELACRVFEQHAMLDFDRDRDDDGPTLRDMCGLDLGPYDRRR